MRWRLLHFRYWILQRPSRMRPGIETIWWQNQIGWILTSIPEQSTEGLRHNTIQMTLNSLVWDYATPLIRRHMRHDLNRWRLVHMDLEPCRRNRPFGPLPSPPFQIRFQCDTLREHSILSRQCPLPSPDDRSRHQIHRGRLTSCNDRHRLTWLHQHASW